MSKRNHHYCCHIRTMILIIVDGQFPIPHNSNRSGGDRVCVCVCTSALNFIYNLLFIITFASCYYLWSLLCFILFLRFSILSFFIFAWIILQVIDIEYIVFLDRWRRRRRKNNLIPLRSHNLVFRVISNFNFRLRFDILRNAKETKWENDREKETKKNDATTLIHKQTPVINYWNGAVLQQADSDLKQIKHFKINQQQQQKYHTNQMIIIVIMNKIEIRTKRNTGKRKQWDFNEKKKKKRQNHEIATIRFFPLYLFLTKECTNWIKSTICMLFKVYWFL